MVFLCRIFSIRTVLGEITRFTTSTPFPPPSHIPCPVFFFTLSYSPFAKTQIKFRIDYIPLAIGMYVPRAFKQVFPARSLPPVSFYICMYLWKIVSVCAWVKYTNSIWFHNRHAHAFNCQLIVGEKMTFSVWFFFRRGTEMRENDFVNEGTIRNRKIILFFRLWRLCNRFLEALSIFFISEAAGFIGLDYLLICVVECFECLFLRKYSSVSLLRIWFSVDLALCLSGTECGCSWMVFVVGFNLIGFCVYLRYKSENYPGFWRQFSFFFFFDAIFIESKLGRLPK